MPIRVPGSNASVQVGPIRRHGSAPVSVDFTRQLKGGSITGIAVESLTPDVVAIGDGSASFTGPAGTKVPPAPSHSAGIVVFEAFIPDGATVENGSHHEILVSIMSTTIADSCRLVCAVFD